MNQTHIHLLITHFPIIGCILGVLVLIHGIWRKSNSTLMAAYSILIISAIGACIAYATGESAEETVEHIQGISKNIIEEHAASALPSLIGLIVVGIISMAGVFVTWKSHSLTRPFAWIALFTSLTAFGFVARTGYLGGQIRHTEIGANSVSTSKEVSGKKDD
ncbi:putative membrane protein [Pedobacter cryoconitis]|uniref:Putative membrane protein n=1 Tax=Pedobacter cryoconitis TaxID=188932 RepID=A0A7W9E1J8_9SPHI|nr:DUF2231 domain-containing protein [Pedobacter cryoconitis]MBB5638394.1 putative membrane protein [Pedobacter cryoconitis]